MMPSRLPRWISLVLVLLPVGLWAKPKEKTYNAPPDKVFAALSKVIEKHHVVTFADDKNRSISFHTGTSLSTYGMNCTALVEADGSKSKVSITTQKTNGQLFAWGAGDRIADDIFKWTAQELATSPPGEDKSK